MAEYKLEKVYILISIKDNKLERLEACSCREMAEYYLKQFDNPQDFKILERWIDDD